jgi:ribonuclease HI
MYYVVKIGRQPGIYETWTEAEKHVSGYSGAKYKSFKTLEEAEAWLNPTKTPELAVCGMQISTVSQTPKYPATKVVFDYKSYKLDQIIYEICNGSIPLTSTQHNNTLYIFTDGSYKKSTNKSGAGVYFGGDTGFSIQLPNGYTNNQGELIGILFALQQIMLNISILQKSGTQVVIISDSMYCINTVTKWMQAWSKKQWKKAGGEEILNPELIQAIYKLWNTITKNELKGRVNFLHQRSHMTPPTNKDTIEYIYWHGNHVADYLAGSDN